MQVLPINKQNTNFKGLIFHKNSKSIITQNNKALLNEADKITKRLENLKEWDLHATANSKNDITFYWTKGEDKSPMMQYQVYPFSKLEVKHTSADGNNHISSKQAEDAYNALKKQHTSLIEKLNVAADITLEIAKNDKI